MSLKSGLRFNGEFIEEVTGKHTPGPWRINEHGDVVADGMPTYRQIVPTCSDPDSARPRVCSFYRPHSPSERGYHAEGVALIESVNAANARLISAAPELFEALKLLLAFDENLMDKVMSNPKRDTLAYRIKVAIAKADPGYFPGFKPEAA